jgi:hypothetical protein
VNISEQLQNAVICTSLYRTNNALNTQGMENPPTAHNNKKRNDVDNTNEISTSLQNEKKERKSTASLFPKVEVTTERTL